MTQTESNATDLMRGDVLNTLLGIDGDAPLAQLRAQRPEATEHTQGSYAALFDAPSRTALTPAERFAVALRVATLHDEPALIAHYDERLHASGGAEADGIAAAARGGDIEALPPRLRAMLAHANLLVIQPAAATPAHLAALQAAGLDAPAIVTLSQIIAFVSFQLRVFVGLTLLGGDDRAAPARSIGPHAAPSSGFTQEQLDWSPWIAPFAAADATEEQRAVLPGQRIDSPYFRLLALDPPVLDERTATDRGIFYTHGGLPRPDRELSAAATSRVNGCIYCASVHSRLAAQLSGRPEDVQRLLDEGVDAALDDRWRALVDLAAALTLTPPAATQEHISALRALGLGDLDLLDALQAAAFFAWANRLMLTLGEPLRPNAAE